MTLISCILEVFQGEEMRTGLRGVGLRESYGEDYINELTRLQSAVEELERTTTALRLPLDLPPLCQYMSECSVLCKRYSLCNISSMETIAHNINDW
jgi:hypothetical protein